jgi:hypothetical protein
VSKLAKQQPLQLQYAADRFLLQSFAGVESRLNMSG